MRGEVLNSRYQPLVSMLNAVSADILVLLAWPKGCYGATLTMVSRGTSHLSLASNDMSGARAACSRGQGMRRTVVKPDLLRLWYATSSVRL